MNHLEIEQLKKYGERQLNREETTRAVLHLGECGACFDSFRQMFPALSDAAREVSVDNLTAADDGEIFHLDYEEHLRPHIDCEIDEATREIVESHLQNCSFCARAARELREFSDGLKGREIEKNGLDAPMFSEPASDLPRRFSNGNLRRLFLTAAAILILGFGGWLFWRQSETTTFVAENQTPTDAPKVSENENSYQSPDNPPPNPAVVENESTILPRDGGSTNKKPTAVGGKISESKQSEDARLLAALPTDFRAEFQNALRTQKINLPVFIVDLRESHNPRGESDDEKDTILSPNAQAVRSARPTFSWKKFAVGDESYIVTIFDENFNQIAVSPNLRDTRWKSGVILERGKIYKWQVKTEKPDDSYQAQFKVLDENALVRLKIIEKAAPRSPLVRGVGYASEGLLIEAEREFQKEIKNNPRGNLARNLKDSLRKKREHRELDLLSDENF